MFIVEDLVFSYVETSLLYLKENINNVARSPGPPKTLFFMKWMCLGTQGPDSRSKHTTIFILSFL